MRRVLESKGEVIERLLEMQDAEELNGVRVGLCGTYAAGEVKGSTKIDIVINPEDGCDAILQNPQDMENIETFIANYMAERFSNKIVILWYDAIAKQEEHLIWLADKLEIKANTKGALGNIAEEGEWSR